MFSGGGNCLYALRRIVFRRLHRCGATGLHFRWPLDCRSFRHAARKCGKYRHHLAAMARSHREVPDRGMDRQYVTADLRWDSLAGVLPTRSLGEISEESDVSLVLRRCRMHPPGHATDPDRSNCEIDQFVAP